MYILLDLCCTLSFAEKQIHPWTTCNHNTSWEKRRRPCRTRWELKKTFAKPIITIATNQNKYKSAKRLWRVIGSYLIFDYIFYDNNQCSTSTTTSNYCCTTTGTYLLVNFAKENIMISSDVIIIIISTDFSSKLAHVNIDVPCCYPPWGIRFLKTNRIYTDVSRIGFIRICR